VNVLDAVKRIVFSGRTAAGKTTHAKLTAQELGWTYIGMSGFMRQLTRESSVNEWAPAVDTIRAADPSIDRRADLLMSEFVVKNEQIVVDAWLQPWLCKCDSTIRIWLESDHPSRLLKCAVSYCRIGQRVPDGLAEILSRKDGFAQYQFMKRSTPSKRQTSCTPCRMFQWSSLVGTLICKL
jgi:cytidylate kinase